MTENDHDQSIGAGRWETDPDDPEMEVWVPEEVAAPVVESRASEPEREVRLATRGFDANRRPKEVVWSDGRRPDPNRVCTARKTNGEPCTRIAIAGGNVCPAHGGLAPHIQAKARARLQSASDRMAKELLKIAVSDDAPDGVKLAAIKDALDRAGLSAKTAVEVQVGPSKPFEEILTAMMTGGSRAESRARRGLADVSQAPDAEADWIEAEVIQAQTDDDQADTPPPAPTPVAGDTPKPDASEPAEGEMLDLAEALDQLRHTTPQPPAARRRHRH